MPSSYQNLALDIAGQTPTLRLRIKGMSMAPIIKHGEAVIIQQVPTAGLRLGDLIAVRRHGDTLTHRLVSIQSERILTLGDNLFDLDPPITPDMILGRVISLEKKGREISLSNSGWIFANQILAWLGWQSTKPHRVGLITPFPRALFWCMRHLVRLSLG